MSVVKRILLALLSLAVATVTYLVVIIFLPVLSVPKQAIPRKPRPRDLSGPPSFLRQDVFFEVGGVLLSGWLYLPPHIAGRLACVVMSHGFGGTKDAVLERYAQRFVDANTAVFTYDYRHFGTSAGEPRQLFDTTKQLDDLRAAITAVRARPEIDPNKIVLWSTSAAGGYGLVIAAEDHKIAGVISQCPGLDHEADGQIYLQRTGWGYFVQLFMHAQRDKGRSRFGLPPHMIPIVGQPDTLAMLNAPGAYEGYERLMQASDTFRNEVCARLLFMEHGRDPQEAAHDVQCPVLFLVCEQDNLVSPNSHRNAATALGKLATVKSYPIGHFEIYEGEYFEEATAQMIDFVRQLTLQEKHPAY